MKYTQLNHYLPGFPPNREKDSDTFSQKAFHWSKSPMNCECGVSVGRRPCTRRLKAHFWSINNRIQADHYTAQATGNIRGFRQLPYTKNGTHARNRTRTRTSMQVCTVVGARLLSLWLDLALMSCVYSEGKYSFPFPLAIRQLGSMELSNNADG